MAELILTISIPDGKVQRSKERFLAVRPNIQVIDDPNWVDPEDGSAPDLIAKFTDKQWFEEILKQYLRKYNLK